MSNYKTLCHRQEEVSFGVLQKRAMHKNQVLVGFQHKDRPVITSINPKDKIMLRKWDMVRQPPPLKTNLNECIDNFIKLE